MKFPVLTYISLLLALAVLTDAESSGSSEQDNVSSETDILETHLKKLSALFGNISSGKHSNKPGFVISTQKPGHKPINKPNYPPVEPIKPIYPPKPTETCPCCQLVCHPCKPIFQEQQFKNPLPKFAQNMLTQVMEEKIHLDEPKLLESSHKSPNSNELQEKFVFSNGLTIYRRNKTMQDGFQEEAGLLSLKLHDNTYLNTHYKSTQSGEHTHSEITDKPPQFDA